MTQEERMKITNEARERHRFIVDSVVALEKQERSFRRTTLTVKLTRKQFELFELMIECAKGDVDNGCEWVQGYKKQVEQLLTKKLRKKLISKR